MAVLEKLHIRGIRSFGPENNEKITFSTPLTLFLGQNGCGKTTIIECLKYALAGELPAGTRSGSGFVNDPQLSGKKRTTGSIKVLFRDGKGDYITVQRQVEATLSDKANLTFKQLLGTVRWQNADRSLAEDISGRCADIDSLCTQKINVSKAILNNVIFCHQENASWPLDEPKKLKEKFDEIFGATEYNKTVEKLRKMVKKQKEQLKIIKEQLLNRRTVKNNVDKQRDKLDSIIAKLEIVEREISAKEVEMKPLQKRMEEILELENALGKLQMETTGKEKSLEGVNEQKRHITQNISEIFKGTDEELNNKIHAFQEEQGNFQRCIKEMEQKQKEIENKLQETNREQQKMQIQLGQLREEENQHNKKSEDCKSLVKKAKNVLNLPELDENKDTAENLQDLNRALQGLNAEFTKWQEMKNSEEKALQNNIDKVRENFASTKQSLTLKDKQISDYKQKIRELNSKLGSLEHSDSQLKFLETKVDQLQNNLRKRTEDFDELRRAREIEELKDKVNQNEQLYNKLERENRVLQQNYVTEQNIERETLNVTEKRNEISRIKTKYETEFEKIFDGAELPRNLEKSIKTIEKEAELKAKTLSKSVADLEKHSATLEATLSHMKDKLKSYEEELKREKNKATELCQGKEFNKVLDESFIRKEKLQRDKGQYRSAKVMYEAFIREFEQECPCCPVCETDFASKKGVARTIVQKLKGKIEELPRKLTDVERELKKEEDMYNKLQQMKPVIDNIEILSNVKIPVLEAEILENTEKLRDTEMDLASTKLELGEPQELLETCRKVITDATLFDRYAAEILKSQLNLEELERALEKVPSNRTREETEAELGKVRAELSNARNQLDNKKELFDENKRILQNLNTQIQNEIQKKLEAQKLMQERPLIQTQLKESESKIEELQIDQIELNEKINELDTELKTVTSDLEKAKVVRRKGEEDRRSKIETNRRIIREIEKLHTDIQSYISNKGQEKLEKALEELRLLKSKIDKLETAKGKLISTISEKKQDLASESTKFRNLTDNKTLREVEQRAKILMKEIAELKQRIGKQNYTSVYREKENLKTEISKYQRAISSLQGGQDENNKFKSELEEELAKPENKNAASELLKKLYELKVMELSIQDLELYTRALEQSLLTFHKERMVHINRVIRELWRDIYKGNDIDCIEIKTEDTITSGGAGKKRNYSYKVVQKRKEIEFDMRGRCSAGQRVLACLIIRTALADTFSANCGILALDEPTTNLDSENIKSLSKALKQMIDKRKYNKNFQLLVITHDEEFLKTLNEERSITSYYKVERNVNGFSQIRLCDMK